MGESWSLSDAGEHEWWGRDRFLERAVGGRKGIDLAHDVEAPPPDTELVERARRRRFTASTSCRSCARPTRAASPGEIGALLRREGLYSSLLTDWRRQRERGSVAALARPRGRQKGDPRETQIAARQRRLECAERELEKARRVIEVQGNVSALLLGDLLEPSGAQGSNER